MLVTFGSYKRNNDVDRASQSVMDKQTDPSILTKKGREILPERSSLMTNGQQSRLAIIRSEPQTRRPPMPVGLERIRVIRAVTPGTRAIRRRLGSRSSSV